MPKKSYSYIEKKTIEHLLPSPLPLYDPLKVYKKDDIFQDQNGVEYTTVNTNQKFLVLAKTYKSVINGINVVITAYMDPEWFDGSTCVVDTSSAQYISNPSCGDSYRFVLYMTPNSSFDVTSYPSNFSDALKPLHPSIAYTSNNQSLVLLNANTSNTNIQDILINTGLVTSPISPMYADYSFSTDMSKSKALEMKAYGIHIVFKDPFIPSPIIQLSTSFSTLLSNSNSSYFSYFFRKSGSNSIDKFTSLISQSNIEQQWSNYITTFNNSAAKEAPPGCCSVM